MNNSKNKFKLLSKRSICLQIRAIATLCFVIFLSHNGSEIPKTQKTGRII